MAESLFPAQADHFLPFLDPDLESQALIKQYKSLRDAGNTADATALLDQNPRLKQMIINADTLNLFLQSIEKTQKLFLDIEPYILNVATYRGEWSETAQYNKYDIVIYGHNGAIEGYYGVMANIPVGTLPTNRNFWVPITARGEQGASGTGMSQRGVWNNYTTYYLDDCVSHKNKLWAARRENLDKDPAVSEEDWYEILQVKQQVIFSEAEPSGQQTGDVWCKPNVGASGFSVYVKKSDGTYTEYTLATLVDGKVPEEQLPMTGGTFVGTEPPENTKLTWIDISLGTDKGIQKYYNGAAWVPVLATWG